MKKIIYIHGKGGNTAEAGHYVPLFPCCEVIGLDYTADTPWDAIDEFPRVFDTLCKNDDVTLIANSIGAYYAMLALSEKK